ncbi:MAG: MoaD/ThiS family protein [Egibacteraceae bacterium]
MAVRVRLFAAVRDAAGTSETTVEPGPLPAVLDQLRDRYREPFPARLAVCTVLVDGDPVGRDTAVEVADGSEIALLPPFSGGGGGGATPATPRPRREGRGGATPATPRPRRGARRGTWGGAPR